MSRSRKLADLLDANGDVKISNLDNSTALPKAGGQMSGNITMAGSQTVDGRDLSADGSKLDGIDTGAKNDQTASEIKTLLENGIDSVHYVNASIDTEHIGDDQVTADKLANSINSAIAANTSKTGITSSQANAITANTAKTGISSAQTSAITANTAKTGITSSQATAITAALPKAGGTMTGNLVMGTNLVDGIDISARDAVLTSTATTANAAMPKAGGAFTGNITTNGLIDTRDVAADGVTADAALPKAGGAMTGAITTNSTFDGVDVAAASTLATNALPKAGGTITGAVEFQEHFAINDNKEIRVGSGNDLRLYHDGSNSYISDVGTGSLIIKAQDNLRFRDADNEDYINCVTDGTVELYHNSVKKIETTANGVTVSGSALGTMTTDNDGSFAMSASNNFKCTPAGNFALTFTSIVAQSGNILFINSGGHTISAHANTKVDATLLATISTAGTYLLSYFSDGTNVYMTNSAAYT